MKNRFLFLSLLFLAPSLRADESSPVFLSLLGGAGLPLTPGSFVDNHPGSTLLGGGVGFQWSAEWSAGGQFSTYRMDSEGSPSQTVTLNPLTAWIQRDLLWTRLWTPYAALGLGVSRNRNEHYSTPKTNTGFTAGLTAGVRLRLTDFNEVSLETGIRYFTKATLEGSPLTLADAALVFRFYLPQKWIPVEPPVDISLADLEVPLIVDTPETEVEESVWVEGELARLQSDIDSGRYPVIEFERGSAVLLTSSFEALDSLGAILRSHPDVRVKIYGFVEETYTGDAVEALAMARSEVVRNYVIQNFRLNEFRLSSGGVRPLVSKIPGQPAPRPARRIEFEVISIKP